MILLLKNVSRPSIIGRISTPLVQCIAAKSSQDSPEIPKNIIADLYTATSQTEFGAIYDKKPFKIPLDPKKKYAWCCCGKSKSQPFCDGTHRNPHLRIKLRPIHFQVEKEKDYWLCNCKQTANRPFCDGTHKREDIQALTIR